MKLFAIAGLALAVACTGTVQEECARDEPAGDSGGVPPDAERMPAYGSDGRLVRPDDAAEWIFLGASLDLVYSPTTAGGNVFANVFMEPTAFRHYRDTGEFREGTMTALMIHPGASGAAPAEEGLYQGDLAGFEMSVKDSSRFPDTAWAYYGFGNAGTAAASPSSACFSCHHENAATDHVFTQFYPALRGR